MSNGGSLNLRKSQTWPRIKERAIRLLLFCCAAMSILTTVAIIAVLVTGTLEFFTASKPSLKTAAVISKAGDVVDTGESGSTDSGKWRTLTEVGPNTAELRLSGTGEYKHPLDIVFAADPESQTVDAKMQSAPADGSGRWEVTLRRVTDVTDAAGEVTFEEVLPKVEGAESNHTDEPAIALALSLPEPQTVVLPVGDVRVSVSDPRTVRNLEFFYGTEWYPLSGRPKYGVLPLVWGTFLVALIAALFGLPMGLAIAIYLSEYATPRARSIVKPVLEVLAGVPTIVYGFFALTFITPFVLQPLLQNIFGIHVGRFNALSAGIVVGIMIIPMVSSLSEDVLRAVPRSLREASYALGSTRLDVSLRVVVPAALSGIIAAFLLAISRAIGETMAVTLAAGMSPNLTFNVFDSVQTMTSFIVAITSGDVEVGSAAEKSLYAVGLTLFLMTLVMNILSQMILRRFREVYQ